MKKYYLFFKNSISESLVYRANAFLLFISQLISLMVFSYLWLSIYRQGNQLGSYSLGELITYFFLASFVSLLVQSFEIAWRVGDDIRLGHITNFIVKPISYLGTNFSIMLGKSVFNLALSMLVLAACSFFIQPYLRALIDWQRDIFFLIALLMSFIIYLLFFFLIGILSFWMETVQGLNFFIKTVMLFFAGNYIPLELFPRYLMKINDWLPFRYMTWFPIAILQGKVELSWEIFLPEIGWIVILLVLARIIYNKGLKRYEGVSA